MAHKGPGDAPTYDASQTNTLRIGILHSRWNYPIISSLLNGCISSLTSSGIPCSNIIVQSVPGSYELPYAAQRMITASSTTGRGSLVSAATDLLGTSTSDLLGGSNKADSRTDIEATTTASGPLDAVIAIGVLIKGSTMHFEYISDSVSHGLMKVQLETGCPVIFGVLTCLTEEQAHTRAGMGLAKEGVSHGESGHNHGIDWGSAAVEMAVKRRGWGDGKFL